MITSTFTITSWACEHHDFFFQKDLETFITSQKNFIEHQEQQKESIQKLKLKTLDMITALLQTFSRNGDSFEFESEDQAFLVQINAIFKGNAFNAIQRYRSISIGKDANNLFLLSGAGKAEKITNLKKAKEGYEFISDRVYMSKLAYNTKNKIRLSFYKVSNDLYICVNQHLQDYGKALKDKGIKNEEKPYGPIYYDLTVDFYKQMDSEKFQFVSFNIYHGQANETRFQAINAAKTIGNILTLGALDSGITALVRKNAEKIWESRKGHFQKIILNN